MIQRKHFYLFCFMVYVKVISSFGYHVSPTFYLSRPTTIPLITLEGTNILVPLQLLHTPYFKTISSNFEQTSTINKNSYPYQPKGYNYSTPPPPLEETTAEDEKIEEKTTEKINEVRPEKEAELGTTLPPIVLETDEKNDADSVGDSEPFPEPVTNRPGFEINQNSPCLSSESCLFKNMIPGREGVDYPIYSKVPDTNFSCPSSDYSGYYGDIEARCQSFHVCLSRRNRVRHYSFLCPNGTIFSQTDFICVLWTEFNCEKSEEFYSLNENLRWDETGLSFDEKMKNLNSMLGRTRNFPQQFIPALSIRAPSSEKETYGSLNAKPHSLNRSKNSKVQVTNSKVKLSVSQSESEAYEEKQLASGLIVNRKPLRVPTQTTTQKYSFSDEFLEDYPFSVNFNEENNKSSRTYLPPSSTTSRSYLPPSKKNPPLEETTNDDNIDIFPEDDPINDSVREVDYVTSTIRPITTTTFRTTSKPKLNYLPPRPYKPKNVQTNVNMNTDNIRSITRDKKITTGRDNDLINQILKSNNIEDNLEQNFSFSAFSRQRDQAQKTTKNLNQNTVQRSQNFEKSKKGESFEPKNGLKSSNSLPEKQYDSIALFLPDENIKAKMEEYQNYQKILLNIRNNVAQNTHSSILQSAQLVPATSQLNIQNPGTNSQKPVLKYQNSGLNNQSPGLNFQKIELNPTRSRTLPQASNLMTNYQQTLSQTPKNSQFQLFYSPIQPQFYSLSNFVRPQPLQLQLINNNDQLPLSSFRMTNSPINSINRDNMVKFIKGAEIIPARNVYSKTTISSPYSSSILSRQRTLLRPYEVVKANLAAELSSAH